MTFPEDDQKQILRLFGIRKKIWRGERLSEREQSRWDSARAQAPSWPLFQRLKLSVEQSQAQAEAERTAEKGFAAFLAEADEVSISEEDGVQGFSARFKLTDERQAPAKKNPWWRRVLHKSSRFR